MIQSNCRWMRSPTMEIVISNYKSGVTTITCLKIRANRVHAEINSSCVSRPLFPSVIDSYLPSPLPPHFRFIFSSVFSQRSSKLHLFTLSSYTRHYLSPSRKYSLCIAHRLLTSHHNLLCVQLLEYRLIPETRWQTTDSQK